MKVGSLFAGIGGFDLAARWMGWRTIWVSEIDPYCNQILAREWPDAPNLGDITTIDWSTVERPDLLCGGFPCQPHSHAGKRKGSADDRDLWSECARAVRELRPRYAVFENVPGLFTSDRGRFFNRVLSDLAALGIYDVRWEVLSAADVGAPHRRERVWITAYPSGAASGMEKHRGGGSGGEPASTRQPTVVRQGHGACGAKGSQPCDRAGNVAYPINDRTGRRLEFQKRSKGEGDVADATQSGREARGSDRVGVDHGTWRDEGLAPGADRETGLAHPEGQPQRARLCAGEPGGVGRGRSGNGGSASGVADARSIRGCCGDSERQDAADADAPSQGVPTGSNGSGWATESRLGGMADGLPHPLDAEWWATEPADVPRVAVNIPDRVNRLRALGNAIVPACAYRIFQGLTP